MSLELIDKSTEENHSKTEEKEENTSKIFSQNSSFFNSFK